jgi:hypothetical protein
MIALSELITGYTKINKELLNERCTTLYTKGC